MKELLKELAEVGFPVESVSELRTSGIHYRAAIPILLGWLSHSTEPAFLKEDIVRALTVPWAKPEALDPLIDEFRAIPLDTDSRGESLRWTIGNALEVLWDDNRFEELVSLACEPRFGKSREMVVLGLGRSKRPEAGDVLIRLLEDHVVSGHAVLALKKLAVPQARIGLEKMTADERAWVRRAAKQALRSLI